jgi:hypothetical protein
LAASAWDPQSDGLIAACLNFRSHLVIDTLEARIGKPVVISTQAALWHLLQLAGIKRRSMDSASFCESISTRAEEDKWWPKRSDRSMNFFEETVARHMPWLRAPALKTAFCRHRLSLYLPEVRLYAGLHAWDRAWSFCAARAVLPIWVQS